MSEYRTANVYVRNIFAGALSETDFWYSFKYDSDYLNSERATVVSLTLPLQDEEFIWITKPPMEFLIPP